MDCDLLEDPRLHQLLTQVDADLAAEVQSRGCECGGALHRASYPRKPRGTVGASDEVRERLSFCCDRDGCRRRHTPPSVRFFGRRRYSGAVFVLVSAMKAGVSGLNSRALRQLFGVSRSTLKRWRRWWQRAFPRTRCWMEASGRIVPGVETAALPLSLIERFVGTGRETLVSILRLLSPVTTRPGGGFVPRI